MTRLHFACSAMSVVTARRLTRDWCHDRALTDTVSEEMSLLASEVVAAGLRCYPRTAVMELSWEDPEHAQVAIEFRGTRLARRGTWLPTLPRASVVLFEQFATAWGRQATPRGIRHWFVVDTEPCGPKPGEPSRARRTVRTVLRPTR